MKTLYIKIKRESAKNADGREMTTTLREKEEQEEEQENTFAENNNPYDALGIPRGSSAARARRVFLENCKRLHPDASVGASSSAKSSRRAFERMKTAYEEIKREEEETKEREKREKGLRGGTEEVEANDVECGRTAFESKKFDTAIEFFQRALRDATEEDEKAKIHANLSACFLKTNKAKLALEHADVSFDLSKKTFPKALFRRAEALEKMREFPRAREALDKMLRLDATFVDEVHPKLRDLAVKEREYEKKLAISEREKEKRKERGRMEGQQPGTMPKWEISTTVPRGMDDIDVEDDKNKEEKKIEERNTAAAEEEEEEEDFHEKPMIDGMGLEAIEQMMTLAQIKREEAKAMDQSDNNVSSCGAQTKEKKKPSKDFNFKRCRMCGNVCNIKMMSCSSCCLSLADASSFTPVYNLPKVALGKNDGMEESDSEDDKDAYASSSSDNEDDDDYEEIRQMLPVSSKSDRQKKSLEALARRRNERQQNQSTTDEAKSENNTPSSSSSSSLWWWQTDPMFAPFLAEAPKHKRGYDPSLQSAYDELKIPLGSGESRVRDAYLNQIVSRHPDAAGSKKKLLKAQQAYETIANDFWRHDSGCASMREKLDQALKNTTTAAMTKIQSCDPTKKTIFVSLSVYRDLEAQHTLRSLFENAKDPSRVFVGICWQYKTETTTEVSSITGEHERCVCRLHHAVNRITAKAEEEAAKMKGEQDPEKYLMVDVRKVQLEVQQFEDEKEKKAHNVRTIFDGVKNEKEKAWLKNVRETHVNWDSSDGPCYSRHLANRLWGGESHVLYVDAKTAFDADWDETLLRELEEAEKDNKKENTNTNGVVLTAHPLGYDLEVSPVLNPETYETDHHVFMYGKRIFPAKEERNAPAMLTAHTFGKQFPHLSASKLHAKPERSLKSPFVSNLFMFGPSEAFIRDCPSDVHAPFLYLGEELSTSIKLFTKNWDARTPPNVPLLHCHDPRHRRESFLEDRRKGRLLYATVYDAGYGTPQAVNRRTRLNEYSRRRIFQIVCEGAVSEDAAGGKLIIYDGDKFNIGHKRSVKEFESFSGVSILEKRITERAKTVGLAREEFEKNEKRKCAFLVPTKSISGTSWTPERLYTSGGNIDF